MPRQDPILVQFWERPWGRLRVSIRGKPYDYYGVDQATLDKLDLYLVKKNWKMAFRILARFSDKDKAKMERKVVV